MKTQTPPPVSKKDAGMAQQGDRQEKIVAVVVTFNRLDLLPKTLAGIESGSLQPDALIIVNNASTDGSKDFLASYQSQIPLDIVHLPQNVGGAGGFTVGIDRALMRHAADLVWIMDDDTEPQTHTLSALYEAWRDYPGDDHPALVASRVLWTNGQDHPMNTMRTKFGARAQETALAQVVGARPIRSASFVSIMMDAQIMRREGLPLADFFIWNDDFEYSTRLIQGRAGIAVTSSTVLHHTKTFGTTNANPGPRFYNDVRNKLWVFTRRRTLTPLEKLLYGGSTARLWLSTLLKTEDRPTYSKYLIDGLKDGIAGFRSNREVLAGVYELEFPGVSQSSSNAQTQVRDFSLLMATYDGDNPDYLDHALASNTRGQTLAPTEVVIVQDGPVKAEISQVLEKWVAWGQNPENPFVKLVSLEKNMGLARALNQGLKACSYDIVARADSDDLSLPQRFELQLPEFISQQVSVLGGSMEESDESGTLVEGIRQAAVGINKVRKLLPQRNPLFHPTVIFDKRDVLAVGGYEYVPGAEDYLLWTRMSQAGFLLNNISEPLVRYRAGASAYEKRGGLQALKDDLVQQTALYRAHATSSCQFAKNLGIRSLYRLLPVQTRKQLFRKLIGGKSVK